MSAELLGGLALVLGALIGAFGSYLVESRRHSSALREWHLTNRLSAYHAFIQAIHSARSNQYYASEGRGELEHSRRAAVSAARVKLGLLASQRSLQFAMELNDMVRSDYMQVRDGGPLSDSGPYLDLLESTQNSFRNDLGFPAAYVDRSAWRADAR